MAMAEMNYVDSGGDDFERMKFINTYVGGGLTYTVTEGNYLFVSSVLSSASGTASISIGKSSGVVTVEENFNPTSGYVMGAFAQGIYQVKPNDTITVSGGSVIILEVLFDGVFSLSNKGALIPSVNNVIESKKFTGTFDSKYTWCIALYGCTSRGSIPYALVEHDNSVANFESHGNVGISIGRASELSVTVYALTDNTSYPRYSGAIIGHFS